MLCEEVQFNQLVELFRAEDVTIQSETKSLTVSKNPSDGVNKLRSKSELLGYILRSDEKKSI